MVGMTARPRTFDPYGVGKALLILHENPVAPGSLGSRPD